MERAVERGAFELFNRACLDMIGVNPNTGGYFLLVLNGER